MSNKLLRSLTGSQHLYVPEILRQVGKNSRVTVDALPAGPDLPCRVLWQPTIGRIPPASYEVKEQKFFYQPVAA